MRKLSLVDPADAEIGVQPQPEDAEFEGCESMDNEPEERGRDHNAEGHEPMDNEPGERGRDPNAEGYEPDTESDDEGSGFGSEEGEEPYNYKAQLHNQYQHPPQPGPFAEPEPPRDPPTLINRPYIEYTVGEDNPPNTSLVAFLIVMLEPPAPGGNCQWSFGMRSYAANTWHSQVLYVSPENELSVDIHFHDPTQLPNYVDMIIFKERVIPHRVMARVIDACFDVKIPDCAHRECPSADYVWAVIEELERLSVIDLFDMNQLLLETERFGTNPLASDEEAPPGGQGDA
ncbi:hypothetical protein ACHAPT_011575 [Fusarium lateritium]